MAKATIETLKIITLTLNEKEARVLRDIISKIAKEPKEIGDIRDALEDVGFNFRYTDKIIDGYISFI